jgi:acetyl esterase
MNELMKIYVPDGADPDDIRLNPGRAEDLTDFPPSVIVSAEFDPLRDDSEEFTKRLKAAGNDVEYIKMDGFMHGFVLYWQRFHRAKELIEKIGGKVRAI